MFISNEQSLSFKGSHLEALIKMALEEDVGSGDITTESLIDSNLHGIGRLTAKEPLVLAGIEAARRTFELLDKEIVWDAKRRDGDTCMTGDIIAIVQGSGRVLLAGERTALNFLQRLSGIATAASQFVKALQGTKVRVLDTRKTIPAYRVLEKYAVRMGGGTNHRMGLYDHYLIKNNHIAAMGSVTSALKKALKSRKPGQLIEVETRVMTDVEAALDGGADIIMLDNMKLDDVRRAVKLIKSKAKVEVSGNITLDNIRSYADAGVDFISVGVITHSAKAADINMSVMVERQAGEHSVSSISSERG